MLLPWSLAFARRFSGIIGRSYWIVNSRRGQARRRSARSTGHLHQRCCRYNGTRATSHDAHNSSFGFQWLTMRSDTAVSVCLWPQNPNRHSSAEDRRSFSRSSMGIIDHWHWANNWIGAGRYCRRRPGLVRYDYMCPWEIPGGPRKKTTGMADVSTGNNWRAPERREQLAHPIEARSSPCPYPAFGWPGC